MICVSVSEFPKQVGGEVLSHLNFYKKFLVNNNKNEKKNELQTSQSDTKKYQEEPRKLPQLVPTRNY